MQTSIRGFRRHDCSVDQIWSPALEMKPAQSSEEFTRCDDVSLGYVYRSLQATRHYQEDRDLHGGAWTATHIIPISPSPSQREDNHGDHNCETTNEVLHQFSSSKAEHRSCHRRRASWGFPLTPSSATANPRKTTTAQYKRQCRDPIDRSDDTPLDSFLTTSKTPIDSVPSYPAKDVHGRNSTNVDVTIYTPKPVRTSQSSTPVWLTHYSTPSSTASTPVTPIRRVYATSPRTFMLQGFLARHSNGHTMYPKPIKCSAECSDSCLSKSDLEGGAVSLATEGEEEFDERFLLLAQSPNPNEFEYNEFFMSQRQMSAAKHQADSPVFFNGFPLLQMTRMDR